ncbi:DUF6538 domain-containing protein [Acidocella facilis]|uniref:DUF6538 domain-containing protein n=1 Tax=Acidocella facilis TaxID=525 RepID=UPI00047C8D63
MLVTHGTTFMAMCSYVERRRQRYYFRARLPADLAFVLEQTHVVGSLMTNDARVAKIRAARFYLDYAACLHILVSKMRDTFHSLDIQDARDLSLATAAFELGRAYEEEQQKLKQEYGNRCERPTSRRGFICWTLPP